MSPGLESRAPGQQWSSCEVYAGLRLRNVAPVVNSYFIEDDETTDLARQQATFVDLEVEKVENPRDI